MPPKGSKKKDKKEFQAIDKQIKKVVKSELDKAVEDKIVSYNLDGALGAVTGTTLVITPSSSTIPLGYDLGITLAQGTALNQRIGTKVRIKRVLLKLQIILNGAALTDKIDVPMNIRMHILQVREDPNTAPVATDLNNLYISSNGTYTQFLSGSGFARLLKPNEDFFKIFKTKDYKIGYSSPTLSNGQFSNNDYKMQIEDVIDVTKYYSKLVHFNGSGLKQTSPFPWVVFYLQKCNLDITTAAWDPPSAFMTQIVEYEDA